MLEITGYNQSPVMKEDWLKVRLTPEEKEEFTLQAEDEGLSLSSWVRHHLKSVVKAKGALRKPTKKKKTAQRSSTRS
jgi:hypothetical protein